jgi:uncharacterized membrane protein YtjA (UPF0391 family)
MSITSRSKSNISNSSFHPHNYRAGGLPSGATVKNYADGDYRGVPRLCAHLHWPPACTSRQQGKKGAIVMLGYALFFLLVALFAAVLGFTGIAVAAAGIAKILFYVFLVFFLLSVVMHLGRRI